MVASPEDPVTDRNAARRLLAPVAMVYFTCASGWTLLWGLVLPRVGDGDRSLINLLSDGTLVLASTGLLLFLLRRQPRERAEGVMPAGGPAVESERSLARAVEQAAEAVMITDPTGAIVYVNPAFESMAGYSRAEMLGRNPRVLQSGRQSAEFYREMWSTLLRGSVWRGVMENRRKDGGFYRVQAAISPVLDQAGTPIRYVGVQRDVTRERELEDQLRQAQKLEAIGLLAGGLAHDFNNLLTVVSTNLQALIEELPADLRHLRADLQAVHEEVLGGGTMVRKLLGFSRRAELEWTTVRLDELLEHFIPLVRRLLTSAVAVSVEAGTVPAIRADRSSVEQMLLNLATNARDAMAESGGALTFRLDQHEADAKFRARHPWVGAGWYVRVEARDTGSGMDEETRLRIFEPFFTTKPAGKGTGLGMAMVYGLMKQHGGFVHVESAPGQGTRVSLHFPAPAPPAWRVPSVPAQHGTAPPRVPGIHGRRTEA
jgi:PAS domain S-box-containing protein